MLQPFKNQVRIEKSGPDSFSDCHLNKFVDSQDILIKSVVSRPPFDGVAGILSDPVSFFSFETNTAHTDTGNFSASNRNCHLKPHEPNCRVHATRPF
jgi:hypothetical protein